MASIIRLRHSHWNGRNRQKHVIFGQRALLGEAGAEQFRRKAAAALHETGEVELIGKIKLVCDILDGAARIGEQAHGAVKEDLFQPLLGRQTDEGAEKSRKARFGKPHAIGQVTDSRPGVNRVAEIAQGFGIGRDAHQLDGRIFRPEGEQGLKGDGLRPGEAAQRVLVGKNGLDGLRQRAAAILKSEAAPDSGETSTPGQNSERTWMQRWWLAGV